MTSPLVSAVSGMDPIVAALEIREPVDAAVLDLAIKYRNAQIDQLINEANILQVARARLLNEAAG